MDLLLAQVAESPATNSGLGWVPLLVGGGFLATFVLPPLIISMCAAQRRRAWEHAERMKALEMGQVLTTDQGSWARASVCIAIGAGVPVAAFFFTWLASLRGTVADEVWIAPAIVSALSVVSASLLGGHLFGSTKPSKVDHTANGKPTFEADALDVVSRRG